MVLRFINELSPSVPHCRDVTEQPIIDVKANAKNTILPAEAICRPFLHFPSRQLVFFPFFTRGLFVGGCVVDPNIADCYVFLFFLLLGAECTAPRCAKSLSTRPLAFFSLRSVVGPAGLFAVASLPFCASRR